jgi:hypothetical protein
MAEGFSSLPQLQRASKLLGCWEKIVNASYRLKGGGAVTVSMHGEVVEI